MEQTLAEFKTAQKHQGPKKKNKITNSWGVYDYFKYYRTHRPDLHEYVLYESVYFAIIRRVNKLLVEELCRSGEIDLPYRMGKLKVFTKPVKTFIQNDKVITTRPVDWDKTLELWYEDPVAYQNRSVIYREDNDILSIRYLKATAIYKNKSYYNFTVCRDAKIRIGQAIKDKVLEPVCIYGRDELSNIKGLYDE